MTRKYVRTAPSGPRAGSLNDTLNRIEVGEVVYLETTPDEHQLLQSRVHMPVYRRPASMRHMNFTCGVYTAVGTSVGDVRILLRVERMADSEAD